MKGNPVGWFEIYVQDMGRARKFYEAVLARKLEKLEAGGLEMWSFSGDMEAPGSSGSLVKMEGFPSGGNSVRSSLFVWVAGLSNPKSNALIVGSGS